MVAHSGHLAFLPALSSGVRSSLSQRWQRNSMAMVGKHTSEVKDLGADAMITPCPLCHLNLDSFQPKAAAQAGRPIGMPILHMPQAIGLAMGLSPNDMGLKRHIVSTAPLELALGIPHR